MGHADFRQPPYVDATPAPDGGEALHVEHTEVLAKIALNRLEVFTSQVALVNKKLARHGLPPLQVIPGRKHRHYMSDENRGVDSYVWSIDVGTRTRRSRQRQGIPGPRLLRDAIKVAE